MGVLPLQFKEGFDRKKLNITGSELITVVDIDKGVKPREEISCEIKYKDGSSKTIKVFVELILKMKSNIIKMVEFFSMFYAT